MSSKGWGVAWPGETDNLKETSMPDSPLLPHRYINKGCRELAHFHSLPQMTASQHKPVHVPPRASGDHQSPFITSEDYIVPSFFFAIFFAFFLFFFFVFFCCFPFFYFHFGYLVFFQVFFFHILFNFYFVFFCC